MLPEIHASSEVYAEAKGVLEGIPIAGDLGDQQAATFGQACYDIGDAKNTYGTGNFLLLNTGNDAVQSKSGLLTTLGYKIGDQDAVYCLEGAIAITGALVQWLRDNLKMIKAAPEIEDLAKTVDDNGGCYFVPAFSGLFAPYWKSDARGVACRADSLRERRPHRSGRARGDSLAESRSRRGHEQGLRCRSEGAQGRRRHGRQRPADAVPGGRSRSGRRSPEGARDHGTWRGIRRRVGCWVLERDRRPPRELARGQALEPIDGRGRGREGVRLLEEGSHSDVRLGRVATKARQKGRRSRSAGPSLSWSCRLQSDELMKSVQTEVLVIGGGATGSGVAWDAATRGFETILVERKDLAEGTTGRFHGLLHSGGRYAVKDKLAAEECIHENRILRRVASDSIEDTGGYFVTTPWDDPAFGDKFIEGCRACEIPVEEIAPSEAFQAEPRINRDISRVFTVPDAAIDGWKLVWDCAKATTEHGGQVLTYHRVLEILRTGDVVRGARVRSELSGEEFEIHADFTINATGAWAGKIADMAGCPGVQVLAGKGIMIAMNHRLVNTVINRCTMPADGDILVPIRTVSVIGTTDIRIKDPDEPDVTQDEVERMLDDGEKLVPGFRKARALRVWAGVRPLFKDSACSRDQRHARCQPEPCAARP